MIPCTLKLSDFFLPGHFENFKKSFSKLGEIQRKKKKSKEVLASAVHSVLCSPKKAPPFACVLLPTESGGVFFSPPLKSGLAQTRIT